MHALLGERLDALYRRYGPETVATDPIVFVGRYSDPEDREVVGWIASAFAYGQVPVIQANVGRLLGRARTPARPGPGRRPELPGARLRHAGRASATASTAPATRPRSSIAIARAREAGGGRLRGFFESAQRPEDRDTGPLLSRAVARIEAFDYRPVLGVRRLPERSPVRFFFPSPASGSACKRWNLYLRWMVRRDDLDFGLWSGIPASRLVVPTDTHVHRIARRLGLTRRRTADWKAARQITDALARFDPSDPVRFDYALCRIGILDICVPATRLCRCPECPVQEACAVGRRRRAAGLAAGLPAGTAPALGLSA